MQRLFQTFDRHAVRYLLIRGQAAVLYGAAKNAFRAEDRATYQRLLGRRMTTDAGQAQLLRELSRLQKLDSAYGSRVIDDLRRLRARGNLLEEGTPVRALLSS